MTTAMTTATPPPTPERIFGMFNAYQQTAALKAASELDVFTAVGEGSTTPEALALRCQASPRGLRILCDYLVVVGLLAKEGKHYQLTPESALFLDRRSPASIASAVVFLNSPMLMAGFQDLAATVRNGGTILEQNCLAPEHPIWVEFARSMIPMMKSSAEEIAEIVGARRGEPWKVLDIAAGHGIFGITIARHNPQAQIVALDWPNVLALAEENAKAAGVDARFRKLPGDALEVDYGSDYDLILLTNFLHHFDIPTCKKVARKVYEALKPGARAVTLEFVPNEDRVTPPVAAMFSLMMLGGTPAGDAYTFSEYDEMFRGAGFARNELHELTMSPERVIVSYK
jgi:2-polyprenyl-3-methyl-5-hydroxy-6-metoxy-1,4-benzoquinol methylase